MIIAWADSIASSILDKNDRFKLRRKAHAKAGGAVDAS
jgi:hypothetical protein